MERKKKHLHVSNQISYQKHLHVSINWTNNSLKRTNEREKRSIQICLPIGECLSEFVLPFSKCFFIIKIAAWRWTWSQITTSIWNVLIGVICWHVDSKYSFRKKVWDQISDTRVFVAQNNGQTCFGKEKARINCKMRFTKASQKIDCNFTLWFKLILIEHRNGLSKQKCGSIVNKKAYQKHKQLNDPNFTIAFEAFIFYFAFSMQW